MIQTTETITFSASKDEFYYGYQELAKKASRHALLESARGGNLSTAAFTHSQLCTLPKMAYILHGRTGVSKRSKGNHLR